MLITPVQTKTLRKYPEGYEWHITSDHYLFAPVKSHFLALAPALALAFAVDPVPSDVDPLEVFLVSLLHASQYQSPMGRAASCGCKQNMWYASRL